MRRVRQDELLDDDLGTPQEIADGFNDLWWINRNLGGIASTLKLFERATSRIGAAGIRVLEVAAGDGRMAAWLEDALERRGIHAEFTLLDRRLSHLALGRAALKKNGRLVGDALALPFREESFDLVFCNLFLHHLSDEQTKCLLQQARSVARRAVLINDLERNFWSYAFIRLASPFARSRLTRHDGPASVRQAYTRRELAALASASGFGHVELVPLPGLRMGLIGWKQPVNGGS